MIFEVMIKMLVFFYNYPFFLFTPISSFSFITILTPASYKSYMNFLYPEKEYSGFLS